MFSRETKYGSSYCLLNLCVELVGNIGFVVERERGNLTPTPVILLVLYFLNFGMERRGEEKRREGRGEFKFVFMFV